MCIFKEIKDILRRLFNIQENHIILAGIHLLLKFFLIGYKSQSPRSLQSRLHKMVTPMAGIINKYVVHTPPLRNRTGYFIFVIAFFSYTGVMPKLQLEVQPVSQFQPGASFNCPEEPLL
jgi:hypothetical protein